MQQYYCEHWQKQGMFSLDEEESRHVVQVLRHKIGDMIHVVDGKGTLILAKIIDANKKKCTLTFEKLIERQEFVDKIHLMVSPTKSADRFEYFLEKACEIGVGQITPLICKRTERSKFNYERMKKIIVSASKQSKKLYFPTLNQAEQINDVIQKSSTTAQKFITSIGTENGFGSLNFDDYIIVLVGPEGDFTEEEIQLAKINGWHEVSLGNSILRVETAGIVVASQLQFLKHFNISKL